MFSDIDEQKEAAVKQEELIFDTKIQRKAKYETWRVFKRWVS